MKSDTSQTPKSLDVVKQVALYINAIKTMEYRNALVVKLVDTKDLKSIQRVM